MTLQVDHPAYDHSSNDVAGEFMADVLTGLAQSPPVIPPKYFYDDAGSRLFDRICELPEYYPTRTEMQILEQYAGAIGERLGEGVVLVEPGSGSSAKVSLLLRNLRRPVAYVPVEISGDHMLSSLTPLRQQFPAIDIIPVCADFTAGFTIPDVDAPAARRAVFFPGSTIGNFPPDQAAALLAQFRALVGAGGAVVLGVDLRKDPAVLEAAYNDAAGVTAAFNRNLLTRMQQELGAVLDADGFVHRAVWNAPESRIEMHLVSRHAQTIEVGGSTFRYEADDFIITEFSYKYTRAGLDALAAEAGLRVGASWEDARGWFSIQYLEA
ncbi:L-histidine N(alpha)-methyltransferase [Aquisalimonas asiatica]|uniref:Dimethylhistidine N-methyltransferase n=1 Tax=Aquisalimonas asiatica TaxID=406100 RepID=A0A1H8VUZ7_9GAMM|nr:L-histidine N(alpha)-methyltransferase [Aquisalimonas asiatica]SEP19144.1 dimethylhistidine N-methyltransferase [Aquisalimonas asiatica]